jgi:hypothetical protein
MSFDEGYKAGTIGMVKAIETAETLGSIRERKRIIAIIEPFAKCDECDAGGKSDDCSPKLAQHIIALINEGN